MSVYLPVHEPRCIASSTCSIKHLCARHLSPLEPCSPLADFTVADQRLPAWCPKFVPLTSDLCKRPERQPMEPRRMHPPIGSAAVAA